MKVESFTSIEELKSDRVPRKYSKKELITKINAARALNRIRIKNEKLNSKKGNSFSL